MLVKEILELTKIKPIAEIAKESLDIGEKQARLALKQAGCYSVVGQPGWYLDESENPSNLDESIYHFSEQVKHQREGVLRAAANLGLNKDSGDGSFVLRKRHSFDLDVRLVKEMKLHAIKSDKTMYEVVEEAIRNYLPTTEGKD